MSSDTSKIKHDSSTISWNNLGDEWFGLARKEQLNIDHYIRNSNDLFGISDNVFDIVLCSMMLMDCEDFEGTVREIARVLKTEGKLFASVLHLFT